MGAMSDALHTNTMHMSIPVLTQLYGKLLSDGTYLAHNKHVLMLLLH
jgi:hypothetical protein